MLRFRALTLALLLACLLALIPIRPVAAWDHDAHRRMVQDATSVMPPDLRTLLETNQAALLGGCVAPDVEFHDFYNHVWHVDEPFGGGVSTCLEEIDTIIALIQQGAPASEISREFGILAHYIADISCPLHTSSKDPNEDTYHSAFESDVGDHLSEIAFQFDGLQSVSDPEPRLKGCAQFAYQYYDLIVSDPEPRLKGCAQFAYQYYDLIAAAYTTTTSATTTPTTTMTTEQTPAGKYCGSKKSDVYHYPSCHYVDQILPENLIWFVDENDAKSKGYRPCKVCKPPDCGYQDLTAIIPQIYSHPVNAIADIWYTAWIQAHQTTQTTTSETTAPLSPTTAEVTTTETRTIATETIKTTTVTTTGPPPVPAELLGIALITGIVALIAIILVRRR